MMMCLKSLFRIMMMYLKSRWFFFWATKRPKDEYITLASLCIGILINLFPEFFNQLIPINRKITKKKNISLALANTIIIHKLFVISGSSSFPSVFKNISIRLQKMNKFFGQNEKFHLHFPHSVYFIFFFLFGFIRYFFSD